MQHEEVSGDSEDGTEEAEGEEGEKGHEDYEGSASSGAGSAGGHAGSVDGNAGGAGGAGGGAGSHSAGSAFTDAPVISVLVQTLASRSNDVSIDYTVANIVSHDLRTDEDGNPFYFFLVHWKGYGSHLYF